MACATITTLLIALAAVRPPQPSSVWRDWQTLPSSSRARVHSSPACLRGLAKTGRGHTSTWQLAQYDDDRLCVEVALAIDQNPLEPCCKLLFIDRAADAHDSRWAHRKRGYMLVACGESSSALRGMWLHESLRGKGLSKVLLAIWLRMCAQADITPQTQEINKPLLSLALVALGFVPRRQGIVVDVAGAPGAPPRKAHTRIDFVAPADTAALDRAVEKLLGGGLRLAASGADLRRALTFRE
ncbi:hypothetical protein KFE25_007730 [Diacronema lutheri]|uniref:N-acetyltransferase domain-containing protein n=1 Tax=Diacronema lutheri TaxID=2081491 RepID=A0A8J5XV83_DIALT|nr:hypothetical protein KFE25_007730 [Diacronema lutheri]